MTNTKGPVMGQTALFGAILALMLNMTLKLQALLIIYPDLSYTRLLQKPIYMQHGLRLGTWRVQRCTCSRSTWWDVHRTELLDPSRASPDRMLQTTEIVMMPTLSSLVALDVLVMTTYGAIVTTSLAPTFRQVVLWPMVPGVTTKVGIMKVSLPTNYIEHVLLARRHCWKCPMESLYIHITCTKAVPRLWLIQCQWTNPVENG